MPVDVVHFNPRRRRAGLVGRLMPRRPLNNFGDLIGPVIVDRIVTMRELQQPAEHRRLVAVGSIMRLALAGDTVWGTGVNGKSMSTGAAPDLDIRAVRGPYTREVLRSVGSVVPEVYGDPALLWPIFWPRSNYFRAGQTGPDREMAVVPNHNDRSTVGGDAVVSPLGEPHSVIEQIARSGFICGSSLHGIVVAEAFGIPARLIRSGAEPSFKYDDYYSGTGRETYEVASCVEEAIEMGGEVPPVFDAGALLAAFPNDLYAG